MKKRYGIEASSEWLKRKLSQPQFVPIQQLRVSKEWRRITGGRIMFGAVTLQVSAADEFCFIADSALWPRNPESFSDAVLEGILDALFIDVGSAPGRAQFILEAIGWDEEASVAYAYGQAAREAVTLAFEQNEKARLGIT